VAKTWRSLLEESRAWPGTVVLSAEWFCLTPTSLVQRTIDELGPDEVEIVYSARSLVTQIPAAWQETLKRGARHTLEEFVDGLAADGQERWSWWSLDPADVLERWVGAVGADRIHVVTVPPSGSPRTLLLERFGSVMDFDPSTMETGVAQSNESLGVEAAELMRRVAPAVRELIDFENLHWTEEYRWLRRYLGHDVLVPLGGRRIRLPDALFSQLQARSETVVDRLRRAGYRVSGDLEELIGPEPPADAIEPGNVSAQAMLDVAVPAMAALVARVREETLRADRAEAERGDRENR
jgi:hypothetical protein